jgi:hypothetical protein
MPDPTPRKKLADFNLDVGDNASRANLIVDSDSLLDDDMSPSISKRLGKGPAPTSPAANNDDDSDEEESTESKQRAKALIKKNVDGMTLCLLHLHAANTRLQAW